MTAGMLVAGVAAVCFLGLLAAFIVLLVQRMRTKHMLDALDKLLDKAVSGEFRPETFDESTVSKLEAKLGRHLSAAKLRRAHLEEEKGRIQALVSDISHQTKTPLANIRLYTELLAAQAELTPESRELAGQIERSTEKLAFLVDALVKTSRLETGLVQITPAPGSLFALAGAAVRALRPKADEKGVALTLRGVDTGLTACYDPKWCAEAVENILDNAVKYTPPGGRVDVALEEYELFGCIRVADTGKGVDEADLPKIFGRFYRAESAAAQEGVGVGLYLAREIVARCGGYIQVEANPGGGSVFCVYLSKL